MTSAAEREYVESYVTYIHYVEGLYEARAKARQRSLR
jgi:hypothetical protein